MEPNHRENQLLALEVTLDLGFAELSSATGESRYEEDGRRDQTDLLIGLEYSYEAFPSFTAFTHEHEQDDAFTQEMRLVSKSSGPFSWIVGGFYKTSDVDGYSKEYTPGYSEFLVANPDFIFPPLPPGAVPQSRPDNLEYVSSRRTT